MRLAPALALLLATPAAPAAEPAARVDFHRDVFPLLRRACFECHGPDRQKGGLRLDARTAAVDGGDGGPAVVPGRPADSELVRRAALPADADGAMPPRGDRLSAADLKTLRDWIAQGADWPDTAPTAKHWAYVKPVRPAVPDVNNLPAGTRSPVDAFIRARLAKEGLTPSPEAPRAVLARRLSLDLVGLPPSPAEIEAFENDASPDAYTKLVDRLLASPQFGVKWARPWLDAARYADSHGFQRDDFRDLWAYRDWVVNALNADMPFDRFTIEQLAGDLLPNPTLDQLIATGFGRAAPTNVEAGSDPEDTRVSQVFDRVSTVGTVWLGSTLECAQCHDHKYDPFSQADYYRLFAYFNSTAAEAERANPSVPGSIRFVGPELPLTDAWAYTGRGKAPTTLVMKELPKPRPTYLFRRGDPHTPGERVQPGTPRVLHRPEVGAPRNRLGLAYWLTSRDNPLTARVTVNRLWAELFGHGLVGTPEDFGIKGDPPTHPDLLDWLAVEFMEPTKPSRGGGWAPKPWSMKHVIRTVVLSATYRQSSVVRQDDRPSAAGPPSAVRLPPPDDPDNRLYARGPRFRLDAEAIRDNALAVGGLLSLKLGGPPVRPPQPEGLWDKVGGDKYHYAPSPGEDKFRRGLYVVWKRAAPYPSFAAFDAADRMTCRVRRVRSNTPLQALTLLNDPVYVEAAIGFARRVVAETPGKTPAERVRHAFRLAAGRTPTAGETAVLTRLFEAERAAAAADPAAVKALLKPYPPPPDAANPDAAPADLAAWYAVCAALLNLDETITKG